MLKPKSPVLSLDLTLTDFKLNTDDGFLEMFDQALKGFIIPQVTKHPANYEWFTHWLVIEQSTNKTVGGIGTSGLPDENGHIQVGYFVEAQSEGKATRQKLFSRSRNGCSCILKLNPSLRTHLPMVMSLRKYCKK